MDAHTKGWNGCVRLGMGIDHYRTSLVRYLVRMFVSYGDVCENRCHAVVNQRGAYILCTFMDNISLINH